MNDALWKVCPWDSTSFSMLYQVGVATKIYEEINHYQYIATEKKNKKKKRKLGSLASLLSNLCDFTIN